MRHYDLFIKGMEDALKAKPSMSAEELIATCRIGRKMIPKFMKLFEEYAE